MSAISHVLIVCFSEGSGVTYPVRSAGDDEDTLLGQRMRWAEEGDAGKRAVCTGMFFIRICGNCHVVL